MINSGYSENHLLSANRWQDYELIDSGNHKKFERFGVYQFVRPEEQAKWRPTLTEKEWDSAHAFFQSQSGKETGGTWQVNQSVSSTWEMRYQQLRFQARLTNSRHFGVFPEQAAHWDWMSDQITAAKHPPHILNLFGYTGLATLACSAAGAKVTHVDASKKYVSWARQNQVLSGVEDRPIRWIVDDVMKYVHREKRRGVRYDGVVLDPPKFGRGPRGEVWTCMDLLPDLLESICEILNPQPLFIVLTAYAIPATPQDIAQILATKVNHLNGTISAGELVTVEKSAGRTLHQAIYARWQGR